MSPDLADAQKPAPPVPDPVGGVTPHRAKAERKAAGARKAARVATRKAARASKAAKAQATKAAQVTEVPPVTQVLDVDASGLSAAIDAATAPLMARLDKATSTLKAQQKDIRKNARVLSSIAGQRDTTGAPSRLSGVAKQASPAPAGPVTAAQSAEQAQTAHIQRLHNQWRGSYNPAEREAAYRELTTILGISPMTTTPDHSRPFT